MAQAGKPPHRRDSIEDILSRLNGDTHDTSDQPTETPTANDGRAPRRDIPDPGTVWRADFEEERMLDAVNESTVVYTPEELEALQLDEADQTISNEEPAQPRGVPVNDPPSFVTRSLRLPKASTYAGKRSADLRRSRPVFKDPNHDIEEFLADRAEFMASMPPYIDRKNHKVRRRLGAAVALAAAAAVSLTLVDANKNSGHKSNTLPSSTLQASPNSHFTNGIGHNLVKKVIKTKIEAYQVEPSQALLNALSRARQANQLKIESFNTTVAGHNQTSPAHDSKTSSNTNTPSGGGGLTTTPTHSASTSMHARSLESNSSHSKPAHSEASTGSSGGGGLGVKKNRPVSNGAAGL